MSSSPNQNLRIRPIGKCGWTFLALPLLFFIPTTLLAVTFSTETVSGPATSAGSRVSMTIDSDGNLHAAFFENNNLRYAKRTGSSWAVEVVNNENPGSLSIALDGNNRPVIAYVYNTAQHPVRCAMWNGTTWDITTVESGQNYDYVSVGVDGRGYVHAVYYESDNKDLKYGLFNGIQWSTSTLDSTGDVGSHASMALNSHGFPMVAYRDNDGSALKIASASSAGWSTYSVPGGGSPYYISLAVDGYDHPHVGYLNNWLSYARFNGTSWTAGNIFLETSYYINMVLDGNGYEHLSYDTWVGGSNYDVNYASYTGVGWSSATVTTLGGLGNDALALDESGLPHVLYQNTPASQLEAAHGAGSGAAVPIGGNPRGRLQGPTGLAGAALGTSSITWRWTDNAANEWGYRLNVASGGASQYVMIADTDTLAANSISHVQLSLDTNTTYQAFVAGMNEGGVAFSSTVLCVTLTNPPTNTIVTAVTQDTASLDWGPNGNPEPGTEYEIWTATETGFVTPALRRVPTSYADLIDLLPDTTYYLRVRALNKSGVPSAFDATLTTVTLVSPDLTPPAAITDLVVSTWTQRPNELTLRWTSPGDDGTTGTLPAGSEFRIQYTTENPSSVTWSTGNAQVTVPAVNIAPGVSVSTSFTLSPGFSDYYFRIWTHDEKPENYSAASATTTGFANPFLHQILTANANGLPHMAMDRVGDLHVVYQDASGLEYIKRSGGGWSAPQLIDSGTLNDLAVDGDNRPHISFYKSGGQDLWYGYFNGSSWSTTLVDDAYQAGGWSAIAVDAADHPHVSYRYFNTGADEGIKYAFFNGLSWSTATVMNGSQNNGLGAYNDIALDGAGRPAIVCHPSKYFWFDGSVWNQENVSEIYDEPSLEFDGAGLPHVTSYNNFLGLGWLVYSKKINGTWSGENVDPLTGSTNQGLGHYSDVILDGQGYPHITYLNESNGSMKHAIYNGSSWTTGLISVSTETIYQVPSMTIDSSGDTQIVYYINSPGILKMAEWNEQSAPRPMGGGSESRVQAPSGLSVTPLSSSSARYDWTDNSTSELGFRLYGANSSTGPYTLIVDTNTLSANAVTYTEPGLTAGVTYYRYVTGVNEGGVAFSQQISFTLSGPSAPGDFDGLAVGVSSINWRWTDVSNETGYRVADASNNVLSGNLAAGSTEWLETNLSTNTAYSRLAAAFNSVGTSSTSVITRYTLAYPPASTTPAFLSVSTGSVTVAWDANTNPLNVTTYTVVASTNSLSPHGSLGDISVSTQPSGGSPSAYLSGLLPNTTYHLFANAVNGDGVTTAFVALGSTCTLAAMPQSLQAVASSTTTLTFSWTDAMNSSGTLHRVLISTDPAPNAPSAGSVVTTSDTYTTQISTAGLLVNTTYSVMAAAVNHNGVESLFTGAVSTATLALPPASSVFDSVQLSSVALSWNLNGNPPGTIFEAQMSLDNFGAVLASTAVAAVSAGFDSLSSNTTYFFRVMARNWSGILSVPELTLTTVTLPAPPGALPPINLSSTALTAQWSANGNGAGSLYEIHLSTDNFSTVSDISMTTATSKNYSDLLSDTTYYFQVRTNGHGGLFSAFTTLPSTRTLLVSPVLADPSYLSVSFSSLTVQWGSGGNGPSTLYQAQLSSASSFTPVWSSSITVITTATFGLNGHGPDLRSNTTYFAQVRVEGSDNQSGWLNLGSTATWAAAPMSLSVVSVSSSTVQLDWDPNGNPEEETLYEVWQDTGIGFSSSQITLASTSTAQIGNLSPLTTYFFQVRSRGHNGIFSGFSNSVSTVTVDAPPSAVSDFSGLAVGVSSISWRWSDTSGETGYRLRSSTGGIISEDLPAGATAWMETSLSTNTVYNRFLEAFNTGGASSSPVAMRSTYALALTTAMSTEVWFSSVTLTWTSGGNPAGTDYVAQLSTDNFNSISSSSQTSEISAIFTSLLPNTTYYPRVMSLNHDGIATNPLTLNPVLTLSTSVPVSAPLSGSVVSVSAISWMWMDAEGETGYRIRSSTGGNMSGDLPSGTTAWTETGLSTNTLTTRYLEIFNGNGTSTSAPVSLYTWAAPPASVVFTGVFLSSVSLSWNTNTNPSGTMFTLSWWEMGAATQTWSTTGSTASVTGLSADTTYFFSLLAKNGDGISTVSLELSTMTMEISSVSLSIDPGQGGTVQIETPYGQAMVEIPAGAFGGTVIVTVNVPSEYPASSSNAAELSATGVGLNIELDQNVQPTRGVTLTLPYSAALLSALGLSESHLLISRFDDDSGTWVPLPSHVDTALHTVRAVTSHLSLFQIMAAQPASSVDNVRIYPNPLRPAKGHLHMTFANLPMGSELRIYSRLGELIAHRTADASGLAAWDGLNDDGQKAATGVYLVVIEGSGGKKIYKVAVER